jgi:hypothetical protein
VWLRRSGLGTLKVSRQDAARRGGGTILVAGKRLGEAVRKLAVCQLDG